MENNPSFFDAKKTWSKTKDALLGCYLRPYFQKILHTHKRVVYIDGFAGMGKFKDGNLGSPLIAINCLDNAIGNSSISNFFTPEFYFIELNHHEELRANVPNDSSKYHVTIIGGRYEERIVPLIMNQGRANIFLYVDPYGIKALDFKLFKTISSLKVNTSEILINFNSWGFIREACRIKKVHFDFDMSDLVEYDSSQNESETSLSEIANGDYWIDIISRFKDGLINCYSAEKELAQRYCERLRGCYKYVLNMPIKDKNDQLPKYRMIFVTNNSSACRLMVENMWNRKEKGGDRQQSLFELDIESQLIDEKTIEKKVEDLVPRQEEIGFNDLLAEFYSMYGLIFPIKTLKSTLEILRVKGSIIIRRIPRLTQTGKVSCFWDEVNGHKVKIRRIDRELQKQYY